MIPVILRMQGFLTFRLPTEIRFEEFSGDGIFLVSGPTGSGKTSIFDAISFALYGVATTSQRQPAELRSHLISPEEDLSVDFLFRAADHDYRVTRWQKGQRPMKQSLTVDGDEKNQLTKVRDIQEKILEVLGLSADQFCKIVMLPQGEFRNFLSASSKEKSDILRKLFDTDHYARIRELIRLRLAKIKATVDQAEQIILSEKTISDKAAGSLDPFEIKQILGEELTQAKLDCAALNQSRQLLRAQLDALALRLEDAGRINQDWAAKEKLEQALAEALPAEGSYLRDLEKADLLSKIRPLVIHHKALRQNQRSFESRSLKLKQLREALRTSQAAFAAADQDMSKNPQRQEELTRLVIEIDRIREQSDALREKSQTAELVVIKNQTAAGLALDLAKRRDLIEERAGLTLKKERLAEQQMAAQEETGRLREVYQDKKRQMDEVLVWRDLQSALLNGRIKEETTRVKLTEGSRQMDEAKAFYDQLKVETDKQGLGRFSHLLADGQPCPLCGSPSHPEPFKENLHLSQAGLKAAETAWRDLERQQLETKGDLTYLRRELTHQEEEANRLRANGAPSVLELDPALLEQELENLRLNGINRKDEAQELKDQTATLEKDRTALDQKLAQLQGIEERAQIVRDEQTALKLRLATLEDQTRGSDEESLQRELSARTAHKQSLSQIILQAETAFRLRQQEVTRLDADCTSLDKEITELAAWIKEQETWLADELQILDLSREEFLDLEEQTEQETDLRRTAREFLHTLETDRTRLIMISERLNGREKVDLDVLDQAISEKKEEEKTQTEASDAALKHESALENALRKVSSALDTYSKHAVQLDIARRMDLTTGKGTTFENYVLGYYLEGVLINANARLKNMTSGRFLLVRQARDSGGRRSIEGLDLNVFDAYSNSERDVKTLSGGEGFKAALALALGLSDFIQEKKSGIRLDTVFIDEGFGTLDQESLDSAMETIMELQGLGRLVGIISHVEELKERIPTQIVVENRRGDGSVVRVVKR